MPARTTSTIGDRARAVREQLGLNQSEIAERVGISNEVYGRFERGLITPRVVTLLRICEALHVSPNDLLVAAMRPPPSRNDSTPPELRQLLAVLEHADPATLRRLTEVARWLVPVRNTRRAKRSAASRAKHRR